MEATLTPSQSIIHGEFTENLVLENEKAKHISGILNYYKNVRLADLPQDDNKSFELVDRSILNFPELPKVKKYFPFEYKNYFTKVQSWVGYITEIRTDSFLARIEDPNMTRGTYEEAEFSFDEIEEEDNKLLLIGSIFYWSIGYEYRGGTKNKQSTLRFKRLPKVDVVSMDKAADLAHELGKKNWD